nr:DUF4190 domain-containing protein [Planosporangium thailandense]
MVPVPGAPAAQAAAPTLGAPPAGYWAYGPQPPVRRTDWNGFAIASFVLGLVGGVLLSVVFGVVALVKIRKTGQRGKGLAIAGLTLAGVWLLVIALVVVIGVATAIRSDRNAARAVTRPGVVGIFTLRAGDCFRHGPFTDGTSTASARVTVVPCTQSHNAEVIGLVSAGDEAEYPGSDALGQRAKGLCDEQLHSYVFDLLSLPAETGVRWYFPLESRWRLGLHDVTCFLASEQQSVTRSLREDDTTLTMEQQRYLRAVNQYNIEIAEMGDAVSTGSWSKVRTLAVWVASAQVAERATLISAPWSSAVQPAVDRLVADQDAAIGLWHQVGAAATDAEVQALAVRAYQAVGRDDVLAVRRALGLSTTQGEPAHRP